MGGEFGQEREWSESRSLDWHLLDDGLHRGLQSLVRSLNAVEGAEPALHAQPFFAQSAAGEGRCGKPERLGRSLDQLRRRRRLRRLSPQVNRPEPGQTARNDARTPCARID